MKSIAVFCSASNVAEKYTRPAEKFSRLLAEHGYNLVWGGTDKGLMSIIASAVQDNGGKLIGVSVSHLKDAVRKNADEMTVTKTLGERKALMLAKSDAIVMLVGGIGTLDEITEMIELKKHNLHDKPIVILNTDNFYEGLKVQLQKMKDDGFISRPLDELIYFADHPQEAIEYINQHIRRHIKR